MKYIALFIVLLVLASECFGQLCLSNQGELINKEDRRSLVKYSNNEFLKPFSVMAVLYEGFFKSFPNDNFNSDINSDFTSSEDEICQEATGLMNCTSGHTYTKAERTQNASTTSKTT